MGIFEGHPLRNSLRADLLMSAVCREISRANGHAFLLPASLHTYAFIRDNPLMTDLNGFFLNASYPNVKKKVTR